MTEQDLLPEVVAITREAGDVIKGFYRGAFEVQEKSPDNPVTEADVAADTLLRERLRPLVPHAGWLSEETADNPARLACEWVWVVDPLDGTKEFVLGLPEFSVAVALVRAGEPVLAVVYNPITEDVYAAVRGRGLSHNGLPARVSSQTNLADCVVEASRSERQRGEFAPFEEAVRVQTMGSIALKLARTAAGQTDATWSRGPKHEWDICAGVLLVEEGGGVVVDLDERPLRFNQSFPKVNGLMATNGALSAAVAGLLAPHRATARAN
ncbi:MAG: 3'(2'),5'-bisphosphate nucleotidase CysQ [Chloroflexi bacterium]|nr:3'(2'),5'-bisphosphate nucleotidase CysQ [Chloroflexota bacterium]